MNVALYGAKRRWSMTERSRQDLARSATMLKIGPSSMRWDGKAFHITLDEVTAPLPSRIRGTIIVTPEIHNPKSFRLSQRTEHCWWPMVPRARLDADLALPGVRWSGDAYLDCNWGAGPLEQAFRYWSWSRTQCADGSSEIFYDVVSRDQQPVNLALRVTPDGALQDIKAPALVQLPRTLWRLARPHRCLDSKDIRRSTALEDGPFYSRTLLQTTTHGQTANTVHESLCLERFSSLWVQAMLPFRMPRPPALIHRVVILMAGAFDAWRTTIATNHGVGSNQFPHYKNDADTKYRQHFDQPQMLAHRKAPWYRIDRHAEDLVELFLKLEQRDAARRGTFMRPRV